MNQETTSQKSLTMSRYLMYRYLYTGHSAYEKSLPPQIVDLGFDRIPVKTGADLITTLKKQIEDATSDGKAAIALSGGIDSAVMAKFMPKGSKAYTFRCVVPGVQVTDETPQAAKYAAECGLDHEIIEITWNDIVSIQDDLIRSKGAPIHSIEAQICIAAKRAGKAGFTKLILGENADIIYGGMDGLLAKDWLFGEFVERYSYVMPHRVMRNAVMDLAPYYAFEKNGHIDGHDFINTYFRQEALGTYTNACKVGGVDFIGPYSRTVLDAPIDYDRIRSGDTKYVVREAFKTLYPGWEAPKKIPMPRPMNEWMKDWEGPQRPEFLPGCVELLSGDQKWMLYSLERYLNIAEGLV